jgi:nucleotide-binding universal stress UspA family protein
MSLANPKIALIINELNDTGKSAYHHAQLLAKYYNATTEIFVSTENEKIYTDCQKAFNKNSCHWFKHNADIISFIKKENNYSLIVLGLKTNGKKNNTEDIAHLGILLENLSIPVVTLRAANFNKKYKHIVLPLDLTKETIQKVGKAIELSKLAGGATINVLSVLFTDDQFDVNKLTRQMIDVKTKIEKSGIECTAEIIRTSPEEDTLGNVIVDYAHKAEADLIIIMSASGNKKKSHDIDKEGWEIITRSDLPVMNIIPSNN